MRTDACFHIGKTHKVCEDYARAGKYQPSKSEGDPRSYAIVSDGCSSSPDTDFGSRLLTMSAIDRLTTYWDDFDPNWVIQRAEAILRITPLPMHSLDATLLVAHERTDGSVRVIATGDGVVVGVKRDGSVEVWNIDFDSYPGYLSYQLDPERLKGYLAQGYGHREVEGYLDGHPCESFGSFVNPKDGFQFSFDFPSADYETVMVLSDGVHSFAEQMDNHLNAVHFLEVIAQLVAIKGFTGEFVSRRVQSFLNRFCVTNKWHHNDDLAVAALHMPEPEEVPNGS